MQQSSSKLYKLNSLILTNNEKAKVDLASVFTSFVIYESIIQGFLTGCLIINMPRKYFYDKKIAKGNTIDFSVDNKGITKEFTFKIAKVEQAETSQNIQIKNNNMILYLVSEGYSKICNTLFQQKYTGRPEEILKNELVSKGFDSSKFYKLSEPTSQVINFVGMNFGVDSFISLLTRYSLSPNGNYGYLFFETIDGFNFVSIDFLLKQSTTNLQKMQYSYHGYDPKAFFDDSKFTNAGFSYNDNLVPNDNFGEVTEAYNNEYVSTDLKNDYENKLNSVYEREIFPNDNNYKSNIVKAAKNFKAIRALKDKFEFNITDSLGEFSRTSGKLLSIDIPDYGDQTPCLITKVKHSFKSSLNYQANYKLIIL